MSMRPNSASFEIGSCAAKFPQRRKVVCSRNQRRPLWRKRPERATRGETIGYAWKRNTYFKGAKQSCNSARLFIGCQVCSSAFRRLSGGNRLKAELHTDESRVWI